MMLVVGTIGLFVSTLTEVPIAAMASALAVAIVSEVLVAVPQLHALAPVAVQPLLALVRRLPARSDALRRRCSKGALLALAYIVVFGLAGLGPVRQQGHLELTASCRLAGGYCK